MRLLPKVSLQLRNAEKVGKDRMLMNIINLYDTRGQAMFPVSYVHMRVDKCNATSVQRKLCA